MNYCFQVLSNPAIIHDVDEPVDERQQVGPSVYSIDGISNKTQHNDVKEDQEDVQENFMVSTSEILQKVRFIKQFKLINK